MKKFKFLLLFFSFSVLPNSVIFASETNPDTDLEDGIKNCLYEADKYYDFETDFLEFAAQNSNQDMDYQYNVQDIITHLERIRKYKQRIESVRDGVSSIDGVLFSILDDRLLDIKYRDEERKYRPSYIENKERQENKAEAAVTFFQFSNHIITLLYQLTSPCDLSVKTRKYIRLSPTLWPLLNGENEDLGHPENVIYPS